MARPFHALVRHFAVCCRSCHPRMGSDWIQRRQLVLPRGVWSYWRRERRMGRGSHQCHHLLDRWSHVSTLSALCISPVRLSMTGEIVVLSSSIHSITTLADEAKSSSQLAASLPLQSGPVLRGRGRDSLPRDLSWALELVQRTPPSVTLLDHLSLFSSVSRVLLLAQPIDLEEKC